MLGLFLVFLIACIFIGAFLGIILAPLVLVQDKKKLKEIDQKIDDFSKKTFVSSDEREQVKQSLKRELIDIKAKIYNKRDKEVASDKISLL